MRINRYVQNSLKLDNDKRGEILLTHVGRRQKIIER